jgi:hypothetical protein
LRVRLLTESKIALLNFRSGRQKRPMTDGRLRAGNCFRDFSQEMRHVDHSTKTRPCTSTAARDGTWREAHAPIDCEA